MTFALKVEETLKDVSPPEYRQIVVEVRPSLTNLHSRSTISEMLSIAADCNIRCFGKKS